MTELGKDLTKKLESGRYECVICITPIGKKAQAWSCSNCFVVLHLACVKTWAAKSGGQDWRCPHCQFVMVDEPRHECYCKKAVRPDADPYLVVNSCGEVCEKRREGTDCSHTCNLVCHPGPCPPCPLMGPERRCHCRKRVYRIKCSEVEVGGSSCGEVCGKALSCEMHTCERLCHSGPCGSCPHSEQQSCFCGKVTEDRPCGTGERDPSRSSPALHFSCASVCDRELSCGHHRCQEVCHSGPCSLCPLSLVSSCPCGKQDLPNPRSCLDPVPLCGAVCGRQLPCGHKCAMTCHIGPCMCLLSSKRSCRCGSARQDVPCSAPSDAPLVCHQTCSTLRSCGKHQCNTRCCVSFKDPADRVGMHVCRLPCNKKLRCGKHVCEDLCHKGRCSSCHNASFEDWSCPCGKVRLLLLLFFFFLLKL
jgi:transcriptional repressor NF-X1